MTARAAYAVLITGLVVRLAFAALLPLFPDEAYYWEWSRHLASGYFDHPPGVAWTIHFGATLLAPLGRGVSSLGVRLGPVLAGFVASLATVAVVRRLGGEAAAFLAAVVMTVLPLAAAGLVLATPDAPLLATVAIALYAVVRALDEAPRSTASLRWWTLGGIALGLSFASKYTSIILPIGVLAALVARADLRPRLAEPGPWLACAVATLVFAPVLFWNSKHHWVSFTYQIEHGLGGSRGPVVLTALRHEVEFLGGQAGLATPILFVMMIVAVGRSLRRGARATESVLATVAALGFALFAYSALTKRVEPNWPAPAYIPAIVLLCTQPWSAMGRRWLHAGVWLAAFVSALVYVQGVVNVLPVRPGRDPVARAFGWDALTEDVSRAQASLEQRTRTRAWAGGDRYQEAAEIAYHDPGHRQTFAVNIAGRPNQYDLWPAFTQVARAGDDLVLVLDDEPVPHPVAAALRPFFASVDAGPVVELRRGSGIVARRRLYLFTTWRGGWPARRLP